MKGFGKSLQSSTSPFVLMQTPRKNGCALWESSPENIYLLLTMTNCLGKQIKLEFVAGVQEQLKSELFLLQFRNMNGFLVWQLVSRPSKVPRGGCLSLCESFTLAVLLPAPPPVNILLGPPPVETPDNFATFTIRIR